MNLKKFENHISKAIVNRGYDYYQDGNVLNVYEEDDKKYSFTVEGSEDYEVVVHIDNDWNIIYSFCDCPYDFGTTCKHEVAAYFKLFEILNNKNTEKHEVKKKVSLKEILEGLNKEELINIIENVAKNDKTLKRALVFKYSKCSDEEEIKKCKELVRSILDKYTDVAGYLLYDDASDFMDEIYVVIDKIRNIYEVEKNYELAAEIAFAVIEETEKSCEYIEEVDDIYSFNHDVIQLLDQICYEMKNFDIEKRKDMFDILAKKVKYDKNSFWGNYSEDIIAVLMQFSDDEILRETIKRIVSDLIIDKNNDFDVERLSKMLFDILNEYGNEDDCEKFIKANLNFDTFREIMINRYIAENNFEKVIELASDGESLAKHTWNKGTKWKEIRYRAYEALNRREDMINLAKELFLDGNFNYYDELKALYKGNEREIYEELKDKLKYNKNSFNWKIKEMYLKLIVLENDLDEIMSYVREDNSYIEKYADILVNKFYDEVKDVYINLIKKEAEAANCRSSYNTVCHSIKRAHVLFKDDINILVKEFYITYKRKPAFIDELNNINFK